jgi:pyruvate formate lyase activating enzyme
MTDVPPTPRATLTRARALAMREGLRFVYTGNVHDRSGDTTNCPSCGVEVIVRDWYEIISTNMKSGSCGQCGAPIPGCFGATVGSFGRRRKRLALRDDA